MFTLYFGGAEAPTLRKRLIEAGANRLAISFFHLRPRLPKTKPYLLSERFPDHVEILLDAGGYSANNNPDQFTEDEWEEYHNDLLDFVDLNHDRLDLVTEFDFLPWGDARLRIREEFWDRLPGEKFMPVWHPEDGVEGLEWDAQAYKQVALPPEVFKGSEAILGRVNALAGRFGTKFHGLSISRPEAIERVRLSSVTTNSWNNSVRYGETIVWDGTGLRRYNADAKDEARRRHATQFEQHGFNAAAIEEEDPEELARLSVWSFQQWEEKMDRRTNVRGIPDTPGVARDGENPARGDSAPVKRGGNDRHERTMLPVMGISQETRQIERDGETVDIPGPERMEVETRSLRVCDTCYINSVCPAYDPGSECAYDIPIKIETKDQLSSVLKGILEIQTQRVLFARFAEELEGGFPSKTTSTEIDRLLATALKAKEIQEDRDFLRIEMEARGQAGILSRLFGDTVGDKARELDNPLDERATDHLIEDVVDAEVMD